MNHNAESTNDDIKKSIPHSTILDDEIFEETEITLRSNTKRRKNRLDFFCSKPSMLYAKLKNISCCVRK